MGFNSGFKGLNISRKANNQNDQDWDNVLSMLAWRNFENTVP